jgi:hypothetical protein
MKLVYHGSIAVANSLLETQVQGFPLLGGFALPKHHRACQRRQKRVQWTQKQWEINVFGPFHPGDSFRVYRLQRKGVSLDLRQSLTQPQSPLREAWLALLTQQAMGQPAYVLYDLHQGEGMVQIRYRPHQAAADVTFLAPELGSEPSRAGAWSQLLDGACVETASRGVQRLFANLPDSGDEVDVFQQAGFTLYAGEDIYCLAHPELVAASPSALEPRPQRPEDWPAIQKLLVAITPQRVRQAEGGIAAAARHDTRCQRFVLLGANGEDLLAAMTLCAGGPAHWLRILLHPEARHVMDGVAMDLAESLIRWGVGELVEQAIKPIYCNIRQYEGGIRPALESVGFEPYSGRSLVVKHTLAWSKAGVPELAPALKSSAELAPPAYHVEGEPERQRPNGRLAAGHDA